MNRLQLGIRLESLGLPLRRALAEAARRAVPGVQVDAAGALSPTTLSQTGRREFRNLLRTYNVELTALGCPLRGGLDTAEDQQPRLEHVRAVLSLSFELGPRVVVVQAGRVPEEPAGTHGRILRESLLDLGAHGERVGARLALATGLESGPALAGFLRQFGTGSLAVNLDPASLLRHGFDPYEAVRALRGLIAHAYAKDCRQASTSSDAQEVALGQGDLDWPRYLAALEEGEYRGWLTVAPETGADRVAGVASGVAFLRRLVR